METGNSTMVTSERKAVVSALAAVTLWSTVATGFKLGLQHLEPLQLLFAGTLVSAFFFAVLATVTRAWVWHAGILVRCAMFGLINPLLYYLILFEAYDRLPAQIAQPLNYTWSIALAVLAVPLLKQTLSVRTLTGIVVSYAGVLLLLTEGRLDVLPRVNVAGVALALGSTVLWALYWLMNARAEIPAVSLMASSFLFATPVIGTLCALGPGLPSLSIQTTVFGAWVGLLEMGLTFLFWQRALRLTNNAARISQLIFLSPLVSFVLIATVLGESIHATSIAGLIVIMLGMVITSRPSPSITSGV